MPHWTRINRIGAAGVLAALFFGGIEILVFLADGVQRADLHSPAGAVADKLAALLAEPAATAHQQRALAYRLVLGLHLALVPLFGACLWMRTWRGTGRAWGRLLLALQTLVCAVTLSSMVYVLAAQLAVVLPWRRALGWLVLQIAATASALTFITVLYGLARPEGALTLIVLYGALGMLMQAIVFGSALLAVRERAIRVQLAEANAGLRATGALLADTVRASERSRIARDLHDAVGHHLTALHLHLDLALRQSGAAAPAALHTARELASNLLAEVRVVVSAERRQHIDLATAINALCQDIPDPAITVACDDGLEIASAQLAHTLFFCVQEGLTNSLRHARADRLAIGLRRSGDALQLCIEDDGRGALGAAEGNGLRGMRERVALAGGTLVLAQRQRGHQMTITVPLAGSAA